MFRHSVRTISRFSKQPEKEAEYLYGVNAIEMALAVKRRQFHTLIISDSETINTGPRAVKLINEAKSLDIPIAFNPKDKMNRLVNNQPHQNLILKCSKLLPSQNKPAAEYAPGIYVYCDKITDPQNFGAILRSCLYFGVSAVFVSKKHMCPLNSTVAKTSSGASELLEVDVIGKDEEFLDSWKASKGVVISTSVSPQTSHPISLTEASQVVRENEKSLLIFGSEGYGVSPHLSRNADYSLMIPRTGSEQYPDNLVDSLNVNAAVSCILSHLAPN